jgi:hypothetical protein
MDLLLCVVATRFKTFAKTLLVKVERRVQQSLLRMVLSVFAVRFGVVIDCSKGFGVEGTTVCETVADV